MRKKRREVAFSIQGSRIDILCERLRALECLGGVGFLRLRSPTPPSSAKCSALSYAILPSLREGEVRRYFGFNWSNFKKSLQTILSLLVLSLVNFFIAERVLAEESPPAPVTDAGPHRRDGIYAGFSIVNHIGYVDNFNPFSPELAFSYGLTDIKMRSLSLIGGVYYNGEYRPSIYGAVRLDLDRYVDINLGLVSGYLGSPVVPMALFEVRPWKNFGLFFLPGAQKVNGRTEFLPIFGLRATIRIMGLGMNAP